MTEPVCWTVMEGVAGMEAQCRGLAEAMGYDPVVKRIFPRPPWLWLPGGWWPCPFRSLGADSDRLDPPWPEVLITCGRRAVPFALAIRRLSRGDTFTIHIQDPQMASSAFDLVAAPRHDRVRGDNVVTTRGALHPVTPQKLAAAAERFRDRLAHLPRPLVAVLIGGPNGRYRLGPPEIAAIGAQLAMLQRATGAGLCVTPSRRTGAANERALREALAGLPAEIWDGGGDNPYLGYLALADHVLVTADSVSMVSEACATGKPVHVIDLPGGSRRFRRFHRALEAEGCTRLFAGKLDNWSYQPILDAAAVATEARRLMAARRARKSAADPVGNPL